MQNHLLQAIMEHLGKDHMRTGAQQQHGAASEVRWSIMEGFLGGT